ncbi:MAG: aminotransferase class V-fold PLP-dependent enzyme [Candidatus Promineofilum sp.]|nr:aminotransferase class V-fold PLP-dependent enzyme [Promineifilum sp.]
MNQLRSHYLLDPNVIFLNHGSFGATPRTVFDTYQSWQRRLEWQPVRFLGTELAGHLAEARAALGDILGADAADLVYIPNATFGVNVVARSLRLDAGDEVLATDHEYGACDRVWRYLSRERGFTYRRQPVALPLTTDEELIDQFWQGVTPRTRVIFLSHLTSPTAVRLPVATLCARARAAGILTLIDGAHAPGQIDLDLPAIGADFYTGNCHKWLSSPKGAAFLYAHREAQALIEPLVVGWGYDAEPEMSYGSRFLDTLQWLGTIDYAAYLSVPAAIRFQAEHDWPAVQQACHHLLGNALAGIGALTGLPSVYPDDTHYHQMAVAPLPPATDIVALKRRLLDAYRIEIPCTRWNDRPFIRVSIQAYNTAEDVAALIEALGVLLGE